MTSTTVLVLAGGSLADKSLGPSPLLSRSPAELPDGSGFALERIRERLHNAPKIKTLMVVVNTNNAQPRPMRRGPQWEWPAIPQPNVVASLEAALSFVRTEQVLIQPITTLPRITAGRLLDRVWGSSSATGKLSAISGLDSDASAVPPETAAKNG